MAGPDLAWSWEPHFQITANEDVYNEDMQKMFPEYEWGPKILTHDRTNNEEINLLGWVFRLSIEIINVHINLCSANLHKSCILTKPKLNSTIPCPHCPHTRKDAHLYYISGCPSLPPSLHSTPPNSTLNSALFSMSVTTLPLMKFGVCNNKYVTQSPLWILVWF